jgi:MoaA/NifB/PqqE/SkfB family radical SAM enzyme
MSVRDNVFTWKHLCHVFTAHYNEVLLYENFEEMLHIFRKYRFYAPILSNGIPLTPDKTDIIKKYNDVVLGVHLNIPAGNPEDYQKYTEQSPESFQKLVDNINYFQKVFPGNQKKNKMTIVNNGVNDETIDHRGFIMGGFDIPLYDLQKQNKQLQELFPNIKVHMAGGMNDRCGILKDFNIINNSSLYPQEDEEITGCGLSKEDGGRIYSWLHMNANGDVFLCCNDYHMEYSFGNIKENSLKDIWLSDEHVNIIQKAMKGICKKCWITVKQKK